MNKEIISTKEFAELLNQMIMIGYDVDFPINSVEQLDESFENISNMLEDLKNEFDLDEKFKLYRKIVNECLMNGAPEVLLKGLEILNEFSEFCKQNEMTNYAIEMEIAEFRTGIEYNLDLNSFGTGNLAQVFEDSIAAFPDSPLIFLNYMEYLASNDSYEEYIDLFESLDLETLTNARLYELYITCKLMDNKQSKVNLYTMLTKKIEEIDNPNIKDSFIILLAGYYVEIGDHNEAKKIYEEYINRDDDQLLLIGYHGYAICLFETEGKKSAISFLQDALNKYPEHAEEFISLIKDFEDDDDQNEPETPSPLPPDTTRVPLKLKK